MIEEGGITKEEFKQRIKRCLSEMDKNDIDLMYVYGDSAHPENVTYLTNYRPIATDLPGDGGYNAVFILDREGSTTLIVDREWYVDWAKEESWIEEIVADSQGDTLGASFDILRKRKLTGERIEVDTRVMPARFYRRFCDLFEGSKIDTESRIVAMLREIKSEREIEIISLGLEILGKAHDAAVAIGKEGVREIDIALEIRRVLANEGVDYPLSLFVCAGKRATIALASPMATNYKLRIGDMVLVSLFCCYKKYCPGVDRNWVVGEASEGQRNLAAIELKVLDKSISLVKPGIPSTEFMKPVYTDYAVPLLKEAGFRNYNIQGYIGHGTGLHFLEAPVLWKQDPTVLKPGMVIHIEPGIYSKDPKVGGIRTADTIVVTETGHKNLTKYPRRIGSLA